MRKRSIEKRSQGMVSWWGLILAVLFGVMLGGLTAWLPAQTGGGGSGRCDWRMFPDNCDGPPKPPKDKNPCDHRICREHPQCGRDCWHDWIRDSWCQNPDPRDPNGLCCQCVFWRLLCKCETTGRSVYYALYGGDELEGWGRCVRVTGEDVMGAECPLPEPPP
ncbi:MAG: hypothetical protein QXI19_14055 [Candidatus Caldarchaeum sp.]